MEPSDHDVSRAGRTSPESDGRAAQKAEAIRRGAEKEAAAARSRHTPPPKAKRQPGGNPRNAPHQDRRKPAAANQPFTGF